MPIIKPGDFDDDRVKALLTGHLESMHANSPPGHVFALDWSGLQKPEISFYALWEGEDLLGFGALKELEPRAGEIKSMRTADAHLRKGVAAAILDHIITEASQRGYSRLSLETGSGPAFEPALKLYRKYGFADGEPFGGYGKSPFNQFLHLDLGHSQRTAIARLTEEQIRAAENDEAWVVLAAAELINGRKPNALDALRHAIDLNPANKRQIPKDPRFQSLLNDPEFKNIVGR
jgi:putative acetyltransferase